MNEIHRHNSDVVNYSSSLRAEEDNLNDVCLESSKTCRGNKTGASLTKFEQCQNGTLNLQTCIGKALPPS